MPVVRLEVRTSAPEELVDVTAAVREAIRASGTGRATPTPT